MAQRPSLVSTPYTADGAVAPNIMAGNEGKSAAVVDSRMRQRYERVAKKVLGADFKRHSDPSNLEWLLEPSRVFPNLTADPKGWVGIPTEAITSSQNLVQIIAVDDNNISMRNVILPTTTTQKRKDIRLMDGLDCKKHYAEVREIMMKQKGDLVEVANWASSNIETVDD